jgi:hypothetical protein
MECRARIRLQAHTAASLSSSHRMKPKLATRECDHGLQNFNHQRRLLFENLIDELSDEKCD